MFKKKINELTRLKKLREYELLTIADTDCEPIMAEMYKSDLLTEIMFIEEELTFQEGIRPFKIIMFGFAVLSLILLLMVWYV